MATKKVPKGPSVVKAKAAKGQKMAKQETTTPAATPVTAIAEELVFLDTDAIDTSFENIRTGDFTEGDSSENGGDQSFEDLVESIKAKGQLTPGLVRPWSDPKNKKITHQLIAGERRYTAITHLEQATGEKRKFKAISRQMDDFQALIANAGENQRENLRAPDLMMGMFRIYQKGLERGEDLSNRTIAGMIGCNPSYASDLLNIKRKSPAVADLWFKAAYQLGIREMRAISKIEDPELQMATYQKELADRMPADPDAEKPDRSNDWIVRAIKTAEKAAEMIGHLERRGCIKKVTVMWEEELETLGVKVKADAKKRDRNRIASRAEKAYTAALNWVEPEVEEEGEEGEEAA